MSPGQRLQINDELLDLIKVLATSPITRPDRTDLDMEEGMSQSDSINDQNSEKEEAIDEIEHLLITRKTK